MKGMKFLWGLGLLVTSISVGACSAQEDVAEGVEGNAADQEPREIIFSVKNFERDDYTRTNLEIGKDGAVFTWAENDTIGIFPSRGDQVSFSMEKGAGTGSAVFTGGSWELKPSSTYYAYYPFSRRYFDGQNSKKQIWVSYKGQFQEGNNSSATTGNYDFLRAMGTRPEEGRLIFNFSHLGAMVQLAARIPEKMVVKKMALATDTEEFMLDGYYDLENEAVGYTPVSKKKMLSLAVKNVECEQGTIVTGYLMVPPTDQTGKPLTIRVYDDRNRLFAYTFPQAGEFKPGKIYGLKATVQPSTDNPGEKIALSCNVDAYLKDHAGLGESLCVAVFADVYNEGEVLMKPFVADKNGNLSYTDGTIYLPEDYDMTLYALAGQQVEWKENEEMPKIYRHAVHAQQTEADYMSNDLMYATEKVTSDGQHSEILFSHVCSGIRIGVKAAPGTRGLTEKQVEVALDNLLLSGKLEMKTGEMTPDVESSKGTIHLGKVKMVDSFGDSKQYAKATVIPQKLQRGTVLFTVKNGNKLFRYTIDKLNGLTLEPGKIHTFEIEIDGDSSISVSTSVEEWEVGETIIVDTDK